MGFESLAILAGTKYIINKKNLEESFQEKNEKKNKNVSNAQIYSNLIYNITNLLLTIIALFLAFKRKAGLGGILLSCCCSPCYIAYALANPV
tara:strand:- start:55 stop:330 length:276 start_codon:yes stop_codon:yes gene_type:complete